jgi:hypothetical protein
MLKVFIFISAVLAAVFMAPMAASAVSYTPGAQVHASNYNPHPKETVTVFADPGFFKANESVSVTVTGVDAPGITFASSTSTTVSSNGAGATSFPLTGPADSTGPYTVTLTSASASGSVTLNVVAGSSTVTPGSPGTTSSGGGVGSALAGLAFTGLQFPGLLVWVMLGLIGLGTAFLIVRSVKRRERSLS